MTPRLAPLPADERGDGPADHLNIVATWLRHPDMFAAFLAYAGALSRSGQLDARTRELLTLRTAVNCGCDYEWGQHSLSARASGVVDDADIPRVLQGPTAAGWSARDAAVVAAADDLHARNRISDETWSVLSEHFDEQQLIEIPMVVGMCHTVGFFGNSVGVEQEPGEPTLP
jgi:alkylhydroperoxidase family enzyme